MKSIKNFLVIIAALFTVSAMANGYQYQPQRSNYYSQPQDQQYAQYQTTQSNYNQNNQQYRQYQSQYGIVVPQPQYNQNQQPREYQQNTHNAEFMKCNRRWSRSEMRSHYDRDTGCMVEVRDGVWVPESAIRYAR